jgi:preprotein translocase subunit SecA
MDLAKFVDKIIARFIGTKHERDIKKLQPVIAAINAREAEVRELSDEGLKTRFAELRAQVQEQLKDADPAEPASKSNCKRRWRRPSCRRLRWCARRAAAS